MSDVREKILTRLNARLGNGMATCDRHLLRLAEKEIGQNRTLLMDCWYAFSKAGWQDGPSQEETFDRVNDYLAKTMGAEWEAEKERRFPHDASDKEDLVSP